MALQHLRSSTANKRAVPGSMSDGQLAINTNLASPGLFFKDSNGDLVKIGPVHVGSTAPNASPAVGGQAGNSKGEQWLDTSGTNPVLKVWDGSAWQSQSGEFVNASGDVMTGALGIIAGSVGSPSLYVSGDTNTGLWSPAADTLSISTGGTDRFRVNSAGRILIPGTITAGNALFQVNAQASASGNSFRTSHRIADSSTGVTQSGTAAPYIIRTDGLNSGSTVTAIAINSEDFANGSSGGSQLEFNSIRTTGAVESGDRLGRIAFGGDDGTNILAAAAISAFVDGEPATAGDTSDMPGRLTFSTTLDGTAALSERMRITSAGLVGINTTAPDALLTVNGVGAFGTGSAAAPSIAITGDLNTGIYSPGADQVAISTSGTEAVRIDSSGRLLVGASASDGNNATLQIRNDAASSTHVQVLRSSDTAAAAPTISAARSRGTAVSPTEVTTDDLLGTFAFGGYDGAAWVNGAIIQAYADGTWTDGGDTTDNPGRLVFSTTGDGGSSPLEVMRLTSDNYLRMAASTGGIQFNGDTAAANALDDYEEGTFTPTIAGVTTPGTGTYSTQVGRYTKISNRVFYSLTVTWSAHTGTGNMDVDGLPFTAQGTGGNSPPPSVNSSNLTVPANAYPTALKLINSTAIRMYSVVTGGGAITGLALDTAATLYISGHYQTAT